MTVRAPLGANVGNFSSGILIYL